MRRSALFKEHVLGRVVKTKRRTSHFTTYAAAREYAASDAAVAVLGDFCTFLARPAELYS